MTVLIRIDGIIIEDNECSLNSQDFLTFSLKCIFLTVYCFFLTGFYAIFLKTKIEAIKLDSPRGDGEQPSRVARLPKF